MRTRSQGPFDVCHDEKVAAVAAQLRAHTPGTPLSLKKRSVAHSVPKRNDARHRDQRIDLSPLDRILAIDPVRRTCTAEPGVTFEALVRATLPYGLVPIVVPELRTITVGGAVSGCSIESTSFVHGGFHDTCLEYEVLTTRGDVLRCTPDNEHKLIFQMMHGSFGTLGILSKLTFRLMPARRYVKVDYERFLSLDDYRAAIRRHVDARDYTFIDGFIHSPTEYVLNLGRFVDRAPYTNRYDWLKVYYQSTRTRREDYLETEQYFFRYDNGVTNVHPKSFLGRLLLGRFLHSSQLLRLAETLRHVALDDDRPTVTLDTFIPFSHTPRFLEWYRERIGGYPIWVVPYRRVRDYEWVADGFFDGVDDDLFLDLAIYGVEQPRGRNLYREIEEVLPPLRGLKTLISYNYYEEEEFWRTWNRRTWQAAKRVTDPDGLFRDLYTKTCRASRGLAETPRARRAEGRSLPAPSPSLPSPLGAAP